MWDYDLTEEEVREILHGSNQTERYWMAARILESAKLEDVWKYLTLDEVRVIFPHLKLKKPIREAWCHALEVWK